jgi:hypothetical protein
MGASRTEQPAPTELPHGLPPLGYLQEIRLYDDDPSPPSVVIVNANVR